MAKLLDRGAAQAVITYRRGSAEALRIGGITAPGVAVTNAGRNGPRRAAVSA
jgi:hypothetical protein